MIFSNPVAKSHIHSESPEGISRCAHDTQFNWVLSSLCWNGWCDL